ncbi:MAG: hypothetical protein E6J90_48340 [Deltaproteobacteria bacterium]|nr:MAG: hypothetical protein E6J90_48340 [Deltaproteobacteria bacterium]
MSDVLYRALERRFAGARGELIGEVVHAEIPIDGAWYRARLAMQPVASVVVGLPCTDGFELTLRWNDRWINGDGAPRAASFDDSFLVETNDLALAGVWLDHDVRSGLLASRYVSGHRAQGKTALLLRDARWVHQVSNDEVAARRPDAEPSEDRMGDMLTASLLLASRPVRWARAFSRIALALGGRPSARIEVGGKPVLRVHRHDVDVNVHIVRRLGPGDPGRLRTLISAHRIASSGETLSLISEGLPRAAWPPPADPSTGTLSIDPHAAALLDAARPSSTVVRSHDVEIAFDGALTDRDRIGAAIELAAWWACDSRALGPYR